ncbi:MAG: hypothetical protein IPM84_20310 [Anaerolineae bacterium]|nr:hypothetical protein [Anaerolineae bacterium]
MYVTVDWRGGRPVTADFENEMRFWLERLCLVGYDLEIDGLLPATGYGALTVCAALGYSPQQRRESVVGHLQPQQPV